MESAKREITKDKFHHLQQTHKQKEKTLFLFPPTASYFPVLKQPSLCMCWWKMDWTLVSEGGYRCQCSMYIIRWHVCADALCMRRPGFMQHSAGQGGRRWGQHSLQPKTPAPLSVWELKLSFVTAGWWIHTFRNTTGRTLTQLPFFKSVIRIVTLANTRLDTVGLHHTQKLFFYLRHKTHANTHKNTHTHAHTYTYTYIQTHTHIHAHTHGGTL